MKINIQKLLAAFLLVGLVASCDKDDTDAVKNFTNEPDLNGRYLGPCAESDLAELSMTTSFRFNTDGSFSRYQDFFTNADCSDANSVGTVEVSGQYQVDNDGAPDAEGGAITFELKEAFVVARTETMVDALNTVSFCGRDDYKIDAQTNISSTSDNVLCPVRDVPDTLYGLYRESDGKFYLNEGGLAEMGQSADQRPDQLSSDVEYVKQ